MDGKLVRFLLFGSGGESWSERDIVEANAVEKNQYFVLWHDSKLKNYELFLDYLTKKPTLQVDIHPILIVDKPKIMQRVEEMWREETSLANKSNKTLIESAKM